MRALLGLLKFSLDSLRETGAVASSGVAVFLLLLVTLWLGAACWASSIAETRGWPPKAHFFLGLLVPFAYPFLLLKGLADKVLPGFLLTAARPAESEPVAETPAPRATVALPPGMSTAAPAPSPAAVPAAAPSAQETLATPFDQAFFRKVAADLKGAPVGPWRVQYGGVEVTANRIVEALPNVVVLEIVSKADGSIQRIRVPYAKIEACDRI
jgi:hypothetical protein